MKIVGVITEYNPFHNGHLYHLEQAKFCTGADYAIAVMSGNFVQRGEPAIIGKNQRTMMALKAGADIVVELPLMYALSSAGYFAHGAVSLLHRLGVVDAIAFGAEAPMEQLQAASALLREESPYFKAALVSGLERGLSYPDARSRAFNNIEGAPDILHGPNNILGVEYINSLARLGSDITAVAIERTVPHIGGRDGSFASASEIRKRLLAGNTKEAVSYMPAFSANILASAGALHRLANLSDAFHYRVRSSTPQQLSEIAEISEGLENRIISATREHISLNDIITHVKTKRYTLSKIKRCFLNIILNIRKETFARAQQYGPPYARVLGFRRSSQHLLGHIQAHTSIPLITNLKNISGLDAYTQQILEAELTSTDIYALSADKCHLARYTGREAEYKTPVILE
ncbi:MAG: nucleotidyltransferase [Defluviitaleaceae bacterium]|nr:nucleotidyltransferase [Defluviitaleaceae bacterium]